MSVGYVPKEFILSIEKNDFLRLEIAILYPNTLEELNALENCGNYSF